MGEIGREERGQHRCVDVCRVVDAEHDHSEEQEEEEAEGEPRQPRFADPHAFGDAELSWTDVRNPNDEEFSEHVIADGYAGSDGKCESEEGYIESD